LGTFTLNLSAKLSYKIRASAGAPESGEEDGASSSAAGVFSLNFSKTTTV